MDISENIPVSSISNACFSLKKKEIYNQNCIEKAGILTRINTFLFNLFIFRCLVYDLSIKN